MQKRAVRHVLLALLLVTGLGAGYVIWDTYRHVSDALALERDVHARLDRLAAATAAIGAAQQAYVAPGQQRGEALTRASVLVQQLYDDAAVLRGIARAAESGPALLAFGSTVDALVKVDDRVREHLRADQELMAADLVYTEARQSIDAMATQVNALQAAEGSAIQAERRTALARGATILGSVAVLWIAVVLALARVPVPVAPAPEEARPEAPVAPARVEAAAPATSIDLDQAAGVCAELARVTSGTALPDVLARAARLLDASGIVVWLGAGEELFPATAHGYAPKTLEHLGPIPRAADNATAAAWRSAALMVVPGSSRNNGAIALPLLRGDECFGVLSVEMCHGREHDGATRAVAAIIAAQLSTVVAPWPAPSEGDAARTDASERAAASA